MATTIENLREEAPVLKEDLNNVCVGEETCGGCDQEGCLIGYSKYCLNFCLENGITGIAGGFDKIPVFDHRFYDEEALSVGIADILHTCKSCSTNHFENCIINILRSGYEVALFGEEKEYEGSAFQYLSRLHAEGNPRMEGVVEEYRKRKDF